MAALDTAAVAGLLVELGRRTALTVGSIHGQFRLDRQAQTERLVRPSSL